MELDKGYRQAGRVWGCMVGNVYIAGRHRCQKYECEGEVSDRKATLLGTRGKVILVLCTSGLGRINTVNRIN